MASVKYRVIYADPPWSYGSKQYQDGGRPFDPLGRHYKSMSLDEIKRLPVCDIVENDAACFLWVTDSHLKEGIAVLEAWGFEYKTIGFVWLKKYSSGEDCVNFAPWTLKSTEVCLLGIRGKMGGFKAKNNVRQFIEAVRDKHSRKPDEARTRIVELFGDVPRLEMFAREKHIGWDVFGDQVPNSITLNSHPPSH